MFLLTGSDNSGLKILHEFTKSARLIDYYARLYRSFYQFELKTPDLARDITLFVEVNYVLCVKLQIFTVFLKFFSFK